jgi:acid-sensing ion channel, other
MVRKVISRVTDFITDFFNHSGIHGFSYLGNLFVIHIAEKLFWLALIASAIYFSFDFSLESWDRYLHKSTVVSVERDHYYWNTSLPSLTICPMERLSRKKYDAYAR